MSTQSRADRFAEALQDLERTSDPDAIAATFASGAELDRPEIHDGGDADDPHAFWSGYLRPFDEIATEFTRISEVGDLAVLEWISRGRLTTGRAIEYRGVSVLDFDGEDRIAGFVTYYDTAAFITDRTST